MDFLSCHWLWMYAAAFLMLTELLAPGFVLFFFGLAAATTGLIRLAFGDAFTPTWQLFAFSLFTVVYLLFLRRWMKSLFLGKVQTARADPDSGMVGRVGEVVKSVEPPLAGRVMVGDAEWTAVSDRPIAAGVAVKVVSQNNLTLSVEPI